jgi:hypothetical protein
MRDYERFLRNLTGLVETFREPELSEFRIASYAKVLDRFDDDQIEDAIMQAATSLKFFPKPVEIAELLEGTKDDEALSAWSQLQEGVQRAGYDTSVVFCNGKIAKVVELMGGWKSVCSWGTVPRQNGQPAEITFARKEFLAMYRALPHCDGPGKVIGYHEANNSAKGYLQFIPEAVVVGDYQPAIKSLPKTKRQEFVDHCINTVLSDPLKPVKADGEPEIEDE